jgi:hypothetical protein
MSAKKKKPIEEPGQDVPAATVTVEVINQPIYEADAYRPKGARFELPFERAEALRHFVKIIQA